MHFQGWLARADGTCLPFVKKGPHCLEGRFGHVTIVLRPIIVFIGRQVAQKNTSPTRQIAWGSRG